jgi:hypothetical protein
VARPVELSTPPKGGQHYTAATVGLVDNIYARYVPPSLAYFDLLDLVHQRLVPRTYVEIGVSTGRSLTLALPGTVSVGIDPEPKVQYHLERTTQVFAQTSDDFFAQHDLGQLLGGRPLDLAFIDGMHHFEFALRDFINLERASSRSTTVLIHDCLPSDAVTADRERTTEFWSGDVWRLILLLRTWRPELEVSVIDWAPTGVGVVRGLDPTSTVLSDHYDEIVEQYLSVPYTVLDNGSKAELLNCVPGDWQHAARRLPDQPFRRSNVAALKAVRTLQAARFQRRRGLGSTRPG